MLNKQFDDDALVKIIDASLIYMCACPAQVAKAILDMRELYSYQQNCLSSGPLNASVHELIADTAVQNHRLMEETLDRILTIEGWDRETLLMPDGLRRLRDQFIADF